MYRFINETNFYLATNHINGQTNNNGKVCFGNKAFQREGDLDAFQQNTFLSSQMTCKLMSFLIPSRKKKRKMKLAMVCSIPMMAFSLKVI